MSFCRGLNFLWFAEICKKLLLQVMNVLPLAQVINAQMIGSNCCTLLIENTSLHLSMCFSIFKWVVF